MLTKATVIGAGAMGTIAAQILATNGAHVALVARRDERVQEILTARENARYLPGLRLSERIVPTCDALGAVANSELVVAAVPCQYLRRVWKEIGPRIEAGVAVCSVVKGIEIGTAARPSQVIAEYSPNCPVAALSGPSVAPELAKHLPATVVVASQSDEVASFVQHCLSTSWFRVYTNPDIVGVEFAGAAKNVIALAAGILDGLKAGDNAKAALITRGLVEITRLGVAMGAREETFVGLAGVGDLITTCVSPVGRNRSAGERIGLGVDLETVIAESPAVIEGVPTSRAVLKLARDHDVEMPITEAVTRVLFDGVQPLVALTDLMNRPLKSEDRI